MKGIWTTLAPNSWAISVVPSVLLESATIISSALKAEILKEDASENAALLSVINIAFATESTLIEFIVTVLVSSFGFLTLTSIKPSLDEKEFKIKIKFDDVMIMTSIPIIKKKIMDYL